MLWHVFLQVTPISPASRDSTALAGVGLVPFYTSHLHGAFPGYTGKHNAFVKNYDYRPNLSHWIQGFSSVCTGPKYHLLAHLFLFIHPGIISEH